MTRTAFIDSGRQTATITIKDGDRTVLTFDESKIRNRGLVIDRYSTSAVCVEFGTTIAGELNLSLDNTNAYFSSVKKGMEITVEIGLTTTQETLEMGRFIITSLTKFKNQLDIVALDRFILLDKACDLSLQAYSVSVRSLVTTISTSCGIEVDFTDTVPLIDSMVKEPYIIEDYTCRQMIGFLAEMVGGVAVILPNGKLAIKWYKPQSTALSIGANIRTASDISEEPLTIHSVVVNRDLISTAEVVDNEIELRIVNNPFIMNLSSQEEQVLANSIYNNLVKGDMYNATASILPIPDLMPLEVVMWDGDKRVAVTRTTFTLNSNMLIEGKADGSNDYNFGYESQLSAMTEIAKEYADNKVESQTQEDIFNKLTNNGTVQGLFRDPNTGQIYFNGQYIQTDTLSANQIKSGILTPKSGQGFVINLDNGSISLVGYATTSQLNAVDSELSNFATTVTGEINAIKDQLDGIVDTYYYDYEPTLNNYPANEWNTEAKREEHEGDLFLDTSTGLSYRFVKQNGTWQWVEIPDTASAQALILAQEAKDTADGKRRVFLVQPTPPYDVGDVWFQGEDGDIVVCVNPKLATQSYSASDWEKKDRYGNEIDFQTPHTWNNTETIASFEAKVYRRGEDITNNYPDSFFRWYLRNEDNVGEILIANGKTCTVTAEQIGYGSTIIGEFTEYESMYLTTKNGTRLTTKNGTLLFAYVEAS